MENIKYWLVVASKDHVQGGVSGGFMQTSHGQANPLKRTRPNDWVIYYSPKTKFSGQEKCQAFTAIGRIKPGPVYQGDMGSFKPYRRDVTFLDCREVPIQSLIPSLSFIKDKQRWGYAFRFGLFEIPQQDFELIASLMLPDGQNMPTVEEESEQ